MDSKIKINEEGNLLLDLKDLKEMTMEELLENMPDDYRLNPEQIDAISPFCKKTTTKNTIDE